MNKPMKILVKRNELTLEGSSRSEASGGGVDRETVM